VYFSEKKIFIDSLKKVFSWPTKQKARSWKLEKRFDIFL